MRSTPPLFVVEPSGKATRRSFSGALIRLGAQSSPQDLKSRLREMRESCLGDQESLVAAFRDEVSQYPGTQCQTFETNVMNPPEVFTARRNAQDLMPVAEEETSKLTEAVKTLGLGVSKVGMPSLGADLVQPVIDFFKNLFGEEAPSQEQGFKIEETLGAGLGALITPLATKLGELLAPAFTQAPQVAVSSSLSAELNSLSKTLSKGAVSTNLQLEINALKQVLW